MKRVEKIVFILVLYLLGTLNQRVDVSNTRVKIIQTVLLNLIFMVCKW